VHTLWLWFRQHFWLTFVGFFLGLAVFARLYHFGAVPVSLYWDEMAIWDDAVSMSQTGRDMLGRSPLQPLFISYGDYKLPMYIWFTTPIAWLTQNPLVGARVVSLLAGLSMLPAIFLLTQSWKLSARTSWVSLLALAWLPWSIHFSRAGFEGHLAAAFVLWSLVAFFQFTDPHQSSRQRILWSALAALLGVAAFYTYYSVRFVWPVLILGALFLWWPQLRKSLVYVLVIFMVWILAIIPMFRADFYHASNEIRLSTFNVINQPQRGIEVNVARQRTGNTRLARVVYNQYTFLARDLGRQMLTFFDPDYVFNTGDGNRRHSSGYVGITWWVTLPLIVIGSLSMWSRQKRILGFLVLWWLIGILPAAVPEEVPHSLRSMNALPVLPILSAVGFTRLWQGRKYLAIQVSLVVIIVGFLFESVGFLKHYFSVYPHISASMWQDGYIPLAQFIAEAQPRYDVIYVDVNDDRFFLYYLPYAHSSWQEIQHLPTEGFKRQELEKVRFFAQTESEIDTLKTLVIKRVDNPVAEQEPEAVIYGATGEPRFLVYE
jgi:hypothetical protein